MFPLQTSVAIRYMPIITWTLIAINVMVFLSQMSLSAEGTKIFLSRYALIPAAFFHPDWATSQGLGGGRILPFLTNIFMHAGWLHIIFNMWTLYIFGPAIEDRLGGARFLMFFLLCGIGASAAHAIVNSSSVIPSLGASGAIAGIMGAYMRLFPFSRLIVMILIIIFPFFFEIPAAFFVGIWFLAQVFQGVSGLFSPLADIQGGIAWWAHIGGFVIGWLSIPLIRQGHNHYRPLQRDEGIHGFLPDGRRSGKGPWA